MIKTILMTLVLGASPPDPGPGRAPTTVIFVNCAEQEQGQLTATGRDQAGLLVNFLESEKISAVYAPFNPCLVETVKPLAASKGQEVTYFRDACDDDEPVMEHILDVMLEKNAGKTIVVCAKAGSIEKMSKMLGIKKNSLKPNTGAFGEVLIVNILYKGEAVAQKLNMNFQKKV
ncbi:hypothetical protein [Chitinophaga caseinilytica]|uniref:Uncharacterized protein n=1 Tax=Chitinophaga caseinilytica TaxID=2267521 RepID=A0ABZ2YZ27_9BACT